MKKEHIEKTPKRSQRRKERVGNMSKMCRKQAQRQNGRVENVSNMCRKHIENMSNICRKQTQSQEGRVEKRVEHKPKDKWTCRTCGGSTMKTKGTCRTRVENIAKDRKTCRNRFEYVFKSITDRAEIASKHVSEGTQASCRKFVEHNVEDAARTQRPDMTLGRRTSS